MKPLSPTFWHSDPHQPETAAELYRDADMRANMRQCADMAAALLPFLHRNLEHDAPCPGWDWEDIIAAVEDASKMISPEACERIAAEQAEARRAAKIAAGERAGALERGMRG